MCGSDNSEIVSYLHQLIFLSPCPSQAPSDEQQTHARRRPASPVRRCAAGVLAPATERHESSARQRAAVTVASSAAGACVAPPSPPRPRAPPSPPANLPVTPATVLAEQFLPLQFIQFSLTILAGEFVATA